MRPCPCSSASASNWGMSVSVAVARSSIPARVCDVEYVEPEPAVSGGHLIPVTYRGRADAETAEA